MKLSTNFVKDYVDIPEEIDLKQLAEDMTRVGNEYDSAEKFINVTNVTIGEVKTCEMHPDSDHLHVCTVDVGSEILDIVCGAPNVRVGLKVIVALPGAELPGGFTIKKGVIRGVESNGMLCSMAELGLDSKFLTDADKNGIHELPEDAPIGEDPIKFLKLDDEVIDFELTANRGDLLSMLGMAYEIGAIYDKPVKEIDLSYQEQGKDINEQFKIDIQTENCSIFLVKKVENVVIKESPDFIKTRLMACGIRPINNVVDISNYVMLETGQPLHFYDAQRLGNKIVVRMAEEGEKLITLDNQERELSSEDIVIADETQAVGLAGVMGGLTTEIEEDTKNIIIESAIFAPVKIRMTSKKAFRSEASQRFEKGLDSNRTYMAINRACNLLEKYADAQVVTGLVKYDTTEKEDKKINITTKNITDLLGIEISEDEILNVFRKLGFTYNVEGETIEVLVPRRRLDISIKEDLIEEVGRIFGVDNIEGKLPVFPSKPGSYDKVTRQIRNKMLSLGLNETLSYILVNDKESKMYSNDEYDIVPLLDPMTEERNTLRYSMIPSLVKIYEYNKARTLKDISIFEIGKGFAKIGEEYKEESKLCALMAGEYETGITSKAQVDFYVMKGVAEELLEYLGYGNRYSFVVKNDFPKEFHPYQTAYISVNNDVVGIIGKLHPSISKDSAFVMEINLDKLLAKKVGKMKFKEISKFPGVKKDIAVIVDKEKTSGEIAMAIKKAAGSLLTKVDLFDVYTGANIDENKKSLAYSLTFEDSKKTLTDEEINKEMEKIVEFLNKKLNAELRK